MIINRAASIPLILHDPYFSIWSSADHLYDTDPVHWCGTRQQIRGYLTLDGKIYCFMGDKEFHDCISQSYVDVTATATEYGFENEKVKLTCRFTSPLLPNDMTLVSRPCTYVDFQLTKKTDCEATLYFEVSADLVRQEKDAVVGFTGNYASQNAVDFSYASMGRARQQPLGSSGDHVTIDWGYVYLACADQNAKLQYDPRNEKITLELPLNGSDTGLILAYDDLLSINYFGQWRKAYWTATYATILEAIGAAFADKSEVLKRASKLDLDIDTKARQIGGESYAFLCNMSFRHAFAAHKLITDDNGNIIFLSKENDSNGCIGTVDVSYPSVPLFLMYNTEYVKGMLRPVFYFAAQDVWEYDFAPHDVGRYPYAWGQVYGMNRDENKYIAYNPDQQCVFPPFYMYPAGGKIYAHRGQMPVEECGNMLIMTAYVCILDQSGEFARPHWEVLKQWSEYLLTYGADPGEQLCTDDFAGHLSHNVNLSAKAIMGIEAFSKIAELLGYAEDASKYHGLAKEMAADWERRALADDHYVLAFGNPETWSLKYNLVWDKIWGSGLFSDEVYDKELAYYEKMANRYGTPLDNRSAYTKSDWILWCCAMADDKDQAQRLIAPVADYLENTSSRVPFSDWYFTDNGKYVHFMGRSVQGGIFMPMLRHCGDTLSE